MPAHPILLATLVFLLGLVVIRKLQRHALIVTIVLSILAIGLLFGCVQMAGAVMPISAPHWDPALDIVGD